MVAFHKANKGGLIHEVETIYEVKFQIQQTYQINAGDLILEYKDKLVLDDDKKLTSLPGFEYDTRITVYIKNPLLKEVKLKLLCSGEDSADCTVSMQVLCGLTVLGLKQELNYKLGVSPYRMRLSFMEDVMTDDNLLRDYIISETPTFVLQIAKKKLSNFSVTVCQFQKDNVILGVNREDTIYTLAFLYREKLKLDPGYEYELTWKGQQLLGPKTLEECDIPNYSVLGVVRLKK
ncbi:hypothetical protein FRX31_017424 [Thalictrum thalictroides]|uniref:Ubiquitin-like domain-containing protein n=1 Tax=Thalictrum thalictroides TaxID=46969 RepID=A0A7J6W7T5_THATH|nr:hypothetical protein FRX31_017424 [Thalictrum thalictroides]